MLKREVMVMAATILGALGGAEAGEPGKHTVENGVVSVTYDGTRGTFAVAEKTSGAVFLKEGKLEGTAVEAAVEEVKDAAFGAGKRIVVKRADGGAGWLAVYEGVPFVMMGGEIRNGGKETIDVPRAAPAVFEVELGKKAGELKTMGTAGLTGPGENPGSYLFLTLADPATRRGVAAGWVTQDRGSGVVFSSVKEGRVEFRTQLDYGHLRLRAGESARLETLAVGVFQDARLGLEQYADAIAKHYEIRLRPQVAGYCTWYSDQHGGAGDEESVVELAALAARELKPFGFSFVQIDDQWQAGGSYNGPRRGFDRVQPEGAYRHGMKPVADKIKALGLTAGVWFMPFARNHQDEEYKGREHWFVKRADGKPYETAWGGTSLDLTQPEVKEHIAQLVKTIHSWGYEYFKMDGLWTGTATEQIYVNDGYRDDHMGNNAPLHEAGKTNIEAYRDGLKLVRQAAGGGVFFSGCNVSQNMRSLGASMGLVDSMRIGPDNGADWAGLTTGPIRGARLYFLNGRVWWNDPDPCYVRNTIPLHHARLLPSWVALSGGFFLNSDWLVGLAPERMEILKRTMPAHGATARPVDYFDTAMPSIWLVSDTRPAARRDVLGLFNWADKDRPIGGTAAWAGLEAGRTYYAFDFWANTPLPPFRGEFRFDVPAQSCRVIAVRAAQGRPVLLSTSRHVSQGIVDVIAESWDVKTNTLSGVSRVVAGDAYELRIAGLSEAGRDWKLSRAEVAAADQAAGVSVTTKEEPGLVRVIVQSPVSREVAWTLRF